MTMQRSLFVAVAISAMSGICAAESFRTLPYLQNPAPDAITVRWFSNDDQPGLLTVEMPEGPRELKAQPRLAKALAYNPFKPEPGGPHPELPYLHSVRVTGLKPGTEYKYRVRQGTQEHVASFRTAPSKDQAIRFVVYSDPETEPESSTSPPVDWPVPPNSNRPEGLNRYVANQTAGYRENCNLIASRSPDFILIAGDLVETGGEQRDWDEFWRHNAGEYGALGSRIPIIPSLGNHENYAGPGGGYTAEGANFSTEKFRTYFEVPQNKAASPAQEGRYYRIDYGPITLITLDSSDGLPNKTVSDTNHNLVGSHAPDFNPGSDQYRWFERQLADAQRNSRFTFVMFHHTAYGSGPHSIPFGKPNFSGQSGIAMRVIQPLLFQYGVDAVFSGHDEMLERSLVTGRETLPDGSTRPHAIHFYDVGYGGDGLRGPSKGYDNPYRQFLAHENAPEVWNGKKLISGGKHYGHLEVNVAPNEKGEWQVVVTPVHAFPLLDDAGQVTGWERRTYDDVVTIPGAPDKRLGSLPAVESSPDRSGTAAALLVVAIAGAPFLLRTRSQQPKLVSRKMKATR